MYFANPWGFLALLVVPAILLIHLYQRRFPPLVVAGIHLWSPQSKQNQPGRKLERLPISASLLLELLAAFLLSLLLADPRVGALSQGQHLVAVLDNSASMQARPLEPGAAAFREAAIAELTRRAEALPRGSLVTLILSGPRPTMLAGPAVSWSEAREKLGDWAPSLPRHSFVPAWDLGLQLIEDSGELLFLSDHLPEPEESPEQLECIATGARLDNVAISAARWEFDAASGKGQLFLRLQNYSKRPTEIEVRGKSETGDLFRRKVALAEEAGSALEIPVPGGLGQLTVDILSPDGLAIDNRVELVEPQVRTVRVAIRLSDAEPRRLLRKVIDALPDVEVAGGEEAQFVFASAETLPESNSELWWFGIGPLSQAEQSRQQARSLAGPFLVEKRHPLLEGITLGGVIWGGAQPVSYDVSPLISSGQTPLLARLNGTKTTGYLLNIDLDVSNLGASPDWPILLANLIELRRESLPGLQRWNYRVGEAVRFRLFAGEVDPAGGGELKLSHGGASRRVARSPQIELAGLAETGLYEIRQGDQSIGRFAVNFQDAEESDLRRLAAGHREPRRVTSLSSVALDNPYSWWLRASLVLVVGVILADWFVLKRG